MALLSVMSVLLPGVTGLVLNETVVPAGLPVAESAMGVENPPTDVVLSVITDDTGPQAVVTEAGLLKSKFCSDENVQKHSLSVF